MKIESTSAPSVFLTGMFRSGTTLLGMMCHNHPAFRIAQDPCAHLFRAYRNEVESRLRPGVAADIERPIDDYYFSPEKLALKDAIQSSNLELAIGSENLRWLSANINSTLQKFAPELGPISAPELANKNFREMFALVIDRIRKTSATPDQVVPGFKQVWMGEFVPHILEAFPQARVIHVMRDPRAVCASKQSREAKYPWLFMIRHWRKHAAFAWKFARDRVMLVKYEDLLTQPDKTTRKICAFLGVNYDARMIDASKFIDGSGKPWAANSAHEQGMQRLNPDMIDAWRKKLPKEQIAFIEALCLPEMAMMDYQPEEISDRESVVTALMKAPQVPTADLAAWIRPYAREYEDFPANNLGLEYLRLDAAQHPDSVPREMKEALFLDAGFFDAAAGKMGATAPFARAIQETTA